MAKTNTIRSNSLQTNSVRLNGVEGLRRVSLQAGEIPDIPPTYTLSASVTNGMVSATLNGSAVNLPFTANEGDTIVVSVTPNDGYEFNGWADGNKDNPRTITMASDVVLSAQCVEVVQPPVGNYIQFEDKAVEAICVENWSSDGIGLTEEDAAAVTSIGKKFRENAAITSFDELRYFVNVDTLDSYSFYKCSALTSIGLSNIKTIKDYALHTTGLSGEIELNSVESWGRNVMGGTSVTSIILPNVIQIGEGAFNEFATLEVVDIGANCSSIGNTAWRSDNALKSIIVRASTPPTLGSNAFQWSNNTFIIYVPDASLEAYKTAVNWSAYADRIHPLSEIEGVVIEDGVTLNNDGTLKLNANYSVVGFVKTNGATSIKWGVPGGSLGTLCEYTENGTCQDYWGAQQNPRTVTIKSSSTQVKAAFSTAHLDNAYIYDNTNGKYLWKGANVE